MSHTSDGENVFHNQWELLSAKLEMQFVCIREKRGEKPQHRTTRTKTAKWGLVISKSHGSNTPSGKHHNCVGALVATSILALACAQVFFISVYCSPAKHALIEETQRKNCA